MHNIDYSKVPDWVFIPYGLSPLEVQASFCVKILDSFKDAVDVYVYSGNICDKCKMSASVILNVRGLEINLRETLAIYDPDISIQEAKKFYHKILTTEDILKGALHDPKDVEKERKSIQEMVDARSKITPTECNHITASYFLNKKDK